MWLKGIVLLSEFWCECCYCCYLVLWAQSAAKGYIRAESKLQSFSRLFILQVIIPQISFFSSHNSNSIQNFGMQTQKDNSTCFGVCLYSVGTQHRNLHPARWPILFYGPTQEPVWVKWSSFRTMYLVRCVDDVQDLYLKISPPRCMLESRVNTKYMRSTQTEWS